MNKKKAWIIVGRFGRVHGVKGFITVHSYTDPRDNILSYNNWHMFLNEQWLPVKPLQVKVNNKSILALIEGYERRELASQLTNIEIAVSKDSLPELKPGEYYWYELIGMQVINRDGKELGKITDIMPTGANDVLVVTSEKRHLIPYLPEQVILEVNKDKRFIKVDWDLDI
ncbi:ribosome maturation factor RimM [Legionella israelensis]|uniref:Ribosome maturation factor RimM n=1 Tax=Legionella israelensis TaxID=454 RepID=A0A0W0V4E9_9GAMM|nr:ribosome maturation factor RimM [Legionella israelensis]KTD15000.1 16S rRNA processing protein RimM [Legionella israelensis]QBR85100.1 ribosome maturation factor RimM [Legionella israelensis]QBS10006.1 ribosome maturation factor RimM [Legionella israelensis]SCX78055.1 16S rRNA processing protein RimM [Legionella israelensis DSM 19235]STX59584.1 16S rRNA processing protein RimM [Legionella israelensis]